MEKRLLAFTLACCVAHSAFAQMLTLDTYSPGTPLHGVDGWLAWDNNLAANASTTSAFARSGDVSIDIVGSAAGSISDLVRVHNITSGLWRYTAWQYIPSSTVGSDAYFILMNTYEANGAKNWSTQVRFDLSSGLVYDNLTGNSASLPLVRDRWVPITVNVDLDHDAQTVLYDNQVLFSAPWVRMGGGVTRLAAIDLYGSSASHTFYDDVSLVSVPAPGVLTSAGLILVAVARRRRP